MSASRHGLAWVSIGRHRGSIGAALQHAPLLVCQQVSFVQDEHAVLFLADFTDVGFEVRAPEQKRVARIDNLDDEVTVCARARGSCGKQNERR